MMGPCSRRRGPGVLGMRSQALLATVYAKSGDLWPILRADVCDITTWLELLMMRVR